MIIALGTIPHSHVNSLGEYYTDMIHRSDIGKILLFSTIWRKNADQNLVRHRIMPVCFYHIIHVYPGKRRKY